ncbi:aminotransferase-like domain-containing protein [Ostreibacterium oceani]|uniref:Aminotransferase class I/II-fold pyridoxal phosphate-dependent enzyme n=1 Tax=Ostreibacterium oceani TaxID=2654998 RepID=A0A6N7EVF1_9GAMM|nr:PLP-dependent aminotransferase family protein [Ostreibacterium oceani]MPV85409.1 aminotransferase class I/II-fold pyridoxal phosphate-dependent enzyme [Ostreibacterium oceani]
MHTIWNISNSNQPKYLAIVTCIENGIKSGTLKPGDKLPPHRKLADIIGVTVSTVTRAYAEAEKRELIQSRVGSGSYIMPTPRFWFYGDKVGDKMGDKMVYTDANQMIDLSLSTPILKNVDNIMQGVLEKITHNIPLLHNLMAYQTKTNMVFYNDLFCQWLNQSYNHKLKSENSVLSLGNQHAIFTSLLRLTQQEEHIAAPALVYPGFINAARSLRLRCHPLSMDDHGVTPDSLEALCRQYKIKLLYLTPNEHNPTTTCMPIERREQIVQMANQYDFYILEDDVNLLAPELTPPAFVDIDPQRVIYFSAVTKIFAGGVRTGIIHAPDILHQKLREGVYAQNWMVPPLLCEIAHELITSGQLTKHVEGVRAQMRTRHQMADTYFHDIPHSRRTEGYFIWLPMPENWRAQRFVEQALKKHVRLYTADIFGFGNMPAPQAVRICLHADVTEQQLQYALEVIRTLYFDKDASMTFATA